ncbi:MAG: triphosphoribosyl-dephospho-CoA synthase [Pirellula sp.]
MTPGQRVCFSIFHEASAIKLGNVHPNASFPDMNFTHFERAAHAIGQCVDATANDSVGSSILACTKAMLDAVQLNTSLGTILLLVPLSRTNNLEKSAPSTQCDSSPIQAYRNHDAGFQRASDEIQQLLARTDSNDCAAIYEAIRIAHPGGLGRSKVADVSENAPTSILDAMRIASVWDDIALQYTNGFSQVYEGAIRLLELRNQGSTWPEAIRRLQLELLASRADSLIVRKLGMAIGDKVKLRAQQVIGSGPFGSPEFETAWKEFDDYLRLPTERKNPGTIADLIAASIYVASLKWI